MSGRMKRLRMPLSFKKPQLRQKDKALDSGSLEPEAEERPQAQLSIHGLLATPIKKRTRAQVAKSSKSSASITEAGVGRKKQKPSTTKKPIVISKEETLGAKLYQKDKPILDVILNELELKAKVLVVASSPSPEHESHQLTATAFRELIVPEISVISEAFGEGLGTIPHSPVSGSDPSPQPRTELPQPPLASRVTGIPICRPKKKIKTTTALTIITVPTSRAPPSIETSSITTPSEETGALPFFPSPISIIATLPELFKEFGQLKTKLKSTRRPSESSGFQEQHQVFQE
ncbi:TMV resistance protein N-like [Pyrus ussuriensis x Pyrus communis]|uniref:TMV resistance protein N-like n=1 Tax=Pyrus ussuriensis x Pyrus communis TaxID=2448454 RepID=A0A5N5HDA5_9ROSA|nr:TMV resistance protein N-like [Pyrus ussuriensis x Pyrus communis]